MSVPKTINFSQFVDLLLARLYELEQEHGPGKFFNLKSMASDLRESIPAKWVFDAGKVLESRGLVTCIFALGGRVDAELTGEGRMFVEEEQGSGVIREYHENRGSFVIVSGEGHQVVVGSPGAEVSQTIEQQRKPAFDLLDRITEELRADRTVKDHEKDDLLTDTETIRQQFRKREPNRVVLASLLEPLSHIASIAGPVANLITLING